MSREQKVALLKDLFGSFYRSSGEVVFYCPQCNHHKKKLSVNLDKDAFKCWVCDYSGKSVYRLVRKYGSFLQRQKWEELDGKIDLSESFYDQLFAKEEKPEETVTSLPAEFISLANKSKPITSLKAIKYLRDRGIDQETILKWKIGYCRTGDYEGRIVVPSFNSEGRVNFFVGRTYTDDWKKYKISEGLSRDIIFNELYVDWKNDITLVEGVFDAFKAENAVPLLGSSLREDSKLFQEIIRHDTPVYIALDPDAEKKALRLIKALMSYDVELYKIDVSGYEDVGVMTHAEFLERKENATPMNSTTYLEYEVQGII